MAKLVGTNIVQNVILLVLIVVATLMLIGFIVFLRLNCMHRCCSSV